jgi:hypothetical protein
MAAELKIDEATERERVGDASTARHLIPVAAPVLAGREKEYVADCIESGWISSAGKYVEFGSGSYQGEGVTTVVTMDEEAQTRLVHH